MLSRRASLAQASLSGSLRCPAASSGKLPAGGPPVQMPGSRRPFQPCAHAAPSHGCAPPQSPSRKSVCASCRYQDGEGYLCRYVLSSARTSPFHRHALRCLPCALTWHMPRITALVYATGPGNHKVGCSACPGEGSAMPKWVSLLFYAVRPATRPATHLVYSRPAGRQGVLSDRF
jgi:hypothetical protein